MFFNLLFSAALMIDFEINGIRIVCETIEPPVYNPDLRLLIITGCDDLLFNDNFEGA